MTDLIALAKECGADVYTLVDHGDLIEFTPPQLAAYTARIRGEALEELEQTVAEERNLWRMANEPKAVTALNIIAAKIAQIRAVPSVGLHSEPPPSNKPDVPCIPPTGGEGAA